ncbi:hypothetical protein [Lacticaseibacillus parakribbianus]|uniref:hypothetical protein n=1 Tax=Lacticaseibacillus parakribbianus TaxID=2970927 RepID=UPI0021CB92CB|nr:hypothetical protein [Lacticaseibacillus parakribbianus]
MRVIDLLALLADYNQNTAVQMQSGEVVANIATYELATVLDAPRLTLLPKAGGHPHRLWELRVLLDRPELRNRYVYLQTPTGPVPAFGFQQRAQALVVN